MEVTQVLYKVRLNNLTANDINPLIIINYDCLVMQFRLHRFTRLLMHAELCAICACVSMHISKTTGWRTETYEQHSDYEAVSCQRYGGRACLQDNMHPASRPHS